MRRLVGFIVLLGVLLGASPALGDPADDVRRLAQEVESARLDLDRLRSAESAAVEAMNAATDDLSKASARAIESRRRADVAREELADAERALLGRAVAAYKGGGAAGDLAVILDSATPDEVFDRLRYLKGVGERDRARIDRVKHARAAWTEVEAAAQADVDAGIAAAARRDAQLGKARTALSAQRTLLQDLDSRHRAALEAAEAQRRSEEEALARAALETAVGPAVSVRVTHEGLQRALDMALAQVGTPYVWGGEKPGGFDCSGLVRYAFSFAGVSVPHRADLQWFVGTHPRRQDLLPGDLVFYSTDDTAAGIHHVGIYLGQGLMVVAPHTGAVVRVQSFDRPDYFGAARLVG
jgi:cell wall-associated NlpC family hydrolase